MSTSIPSSGCKRSTCAETHMESQVLITGSRRDQLLRYRSRPARIEAETMRINMNGNAMSWCNASHNGLPSLPNGAPPTAQRADGPVRVHQRFDSEKMPRRHSKCQCAVGDPEALLGDLALRS